MHIFGIPCHELLRECCRRGENKHALKFSRNVRAAEGKRVPRGTEGQEGALGQRTAGKRSGHHVRTHHAAITRTDVQQILPITHGLFIHSLTCVLVSD